MDKETMEEILVEVRRVIYDWKLCENVKVAELKEYLKSLVGKDEEKAKRIHEFREKIEKQYRDTPTGAGGSFGELLCWEIHSNEQTFLWLAEKWDISVMFLGEVIADHCNRLEVDDVEVT